MDWEKVEGILGTIAVVLLLTVPFLRITVGWVLVTYPDATLAQQVYVWVIVSAILIITAYGALAVWVVGACLLVVEAVIFIWSLLG